jgi:SAM-dependent methyltransferase
MTEASGANAEQIRYWNESGGPVWARLHAQTEAQLAAFGRAALDRAAVSPGAHVIDVGCGAGATTIELGRRVGPEGKVLGLDVSAPLLEVAREAARGLAHVGFTHADASAAELPEGTFDLLFSRFGVMFFADPTAAFAHLRRALRSGGRLCFACWRGAEHNAWMTVPLMAVAEHVPVAPLDPEAPGPLAFADDARVRRILEGAGFADVAFEAHDQPMNVGGESLDEATSFFSQVGVAARAIREAPAEAAARAKVALREALARHAGPNGVSLGGSVWIVTARSP